MRRGRLDLPPPARAAHREAAFLENDAIACRWDSMGVRPRQVRRFRNPAAAIMSLITDTRGCATRWRGRHLWTVAPNDPNGSLGVVNIRDSVVQEFL